MARRMEELTPRTDPSFDWDWSDLGTWQKLVGGDARCVHDEAVD